MAHTLRSEDYLRRTDTLAGWPVRIISYRIGEWHYCHIDNVSPGATISRAEGANRQEAEEEAISKATRCLEKTQRRS